MKILEPGREQKGWSTEATCTGNGNGGGGCGARLLVEENDLYCTYSQCRDETNSYVTFKCPSCDVETDLSTTPSTITSRLPSKATWNKRQRKTSKS